jgi:hypothetical protein
MKKVILSILAIFLLTAGVALAQSANTTAPGPTQQREPGQTSNNLPNPGNPQTDLSNNDTYTEGGTVEGTANESMQGTAGSQTTGNVQGTTGTQGTTTGTTTGTQGTTTGTTTGTGATSLQNETEDAEGMDVDVDTGANAEGAVDVDVSTTADADTDASGIDETGTDTDMDTDTGALPDTAGEMPLLILAGLLALASAFMVRVARRA